MDDAPRVLYSVSDGVATLTLNRQQLLNAIDLRMVEELADAAERAARDDEVWVTVLRGAGRAFSSGIDRRALAGEGIGDTFFREIARATNWLEDMPKLSICVLHGYSIGGGLQIASACDVRIATEDAVLEFGATAHGLVPDVTILRIARLIGMGRAKQLALLNDRISPRTAQEWGLVNWVVPAEELETKLAQVIEEARRSSRTAVGLSKRLLMESFHRDPRTMIDELVEAERACFDSWELQVANAAWAERKEVHVRYWPRT